MTIRFERVTHHPLLDINAEAPEAAIIGIIGEDGAGKAQLLRLAAGLDKPAAGRVQIPESRRLVGADDALNLQPVDLLLLDQTLARHDWVVRGRTAMSLDRLRRAGSTILLVSHDQELLIDLCDEIWWLRDGRLTGRGHPREILDGYLAHVAHALRESGDGMLVPLSPAIRRGDGRARILRVELLGEQGRPAIVWRSGELVTVRVSVEFREAVADPVIGLLIRTRIGLNVYGTNTELEKLKLGPRNAGDILLASFAFRCELCPAEYTATIASHDPDGIWHEWLEDAVAFSVVDSRYTAGVANLRAQVAFDIAKT